MMKLKTNAAARENPHGGMRKDCTLLSGRGRIGEEARLYGCDRDDELFLYQEIRGGFEVWAYNQGVGLVTDVSGGRLFKPDVAQAREFYNSCPVENRFAAFPE